MWAKQGQMQIKNLGNTLFVLLGKDGCAKSDGTFGKVPKGGGGHFQSKNLYCRFFTIINVTLVMNSGKKFAI